MDAAMIPRSVMTWFLAFLLAVFMIALTTIAQAKPLFVIELDDTTITFTDEPCALKAVGNLPYRAYRTQDGKVYEGCAGMNVFKHVLIYFVEDRSFVSLPGSMLKKLTGV
jgi:hypothetical protein